MRYRSIAVPQKNLKAIKKVEISFKMEQKRYDQMLSNYHDQFESFTFNEKCLYLKAENEKLRRELKTLSTFINYILEFKGTGNISIST